MSNNIRTPQFRTEEQDTERLKLIKKKSLSRESTRESVSNLLGESVEPWGHRF